MVLHQRQACSRLMLSHISGFQEAKRQYLSQRMVAFTMNWCSKLRRHVASLCLAVQQDLNGQRWKNYTEDRIIRDVVSVFFSKLTRTLFEEGSFSDSDTNDLMEKIVDRKIDVESPSFNSEVFNAEMAEALKNNKKSTLRLRLDSRKISLEFESATTEGLGLVNSKL
eukprot:TRINITY_DN111347_c0_g1_i1.p2 TRINITY_DN111347_c0_g1~~TRINITY_DN111347_c0_g1_i1.p2  ORF type:complete len:167 (-),score=22.93 TRINITY_DN111347_c0_g1_i1:127-627(-)